MHESAQAVSIHIKTPLYWTARAVLTTSKARLYSQTTSPSKMYDQVMMKAAVIHEAGGPEALKLETLPIPKPDDTHVLIRVKAFGLNRSELFTRQGHSPGVQFPRVLGIEACGLVEEAPGGQFKQGQVVATAMGGMVRASISPLKSNKRSARTRTDPTAGSRL